MVGIRDERAAATRAKLLDAAREEFQAAGYAGGRVDGIADRAGVNKRLVYAHFGSKLDLFNTVLADNVARVEAAVPFTPDDLPDYAVRLFDHWVDDPTSMRLFSWRNVEVSGVPEFEDNTYRGMINQIEANGTAQRAQLPAGHVLALVFAVLLAWVIPAEVFQADAQNHAERLRRRQSVRAAVERITRSS